MQNNSEVARLLESIRLSYESAYLALYGLAIVGQHEFITRKMENIHQSHIELQTIVGEQEAIKLITQVMEGISEEKES